MREATAAEFLKNVSTHRMNVLHEDGIYRHIRFRATTDSWNQWFELVTWPHHLTLSGDMGTWTFSRLEDMFEFFRGSELKINPSYWAEKLQGGNVYGSRAGAEEFDADTFRKALFKQIKDYDLTAKQRAFVGRELLDALDGEEYEHDLYRATCNFKCQVPEYGRFEFDGADLPDGRVYTYRFLWCLYAIVWGIQQWDARKPAEVAA